MATIETVLVPTADVCGAIAVVVGFGEVAVLAVELADVVLGSVQAVAVLVAET